MDVTQYGAVGDGKTLATRAFQAAVDACSAQGGGVVCVPAGVYLCGSVELKSHVTLHLGQGAVLRGSDKLEDYPPIPFVHNELGAVRSLLWAIDRTDLRITGSGSIDLVDRAFIDFEQYLSDSVIGSGVAYDERQRQDSTAKHLPRPTQPIFFHRCERIRMDGVTIRNAPCWTITASVCRDVQISHLTIDNNLRTPNCDGIHSCSSRDVIITDCVFSCGDDCIAVTGITDWDAISENIVIANCVMRSRSAAVRLGHQASKVRNVVVSNLTVSDTNRGLAIFAGKDGWVENASISNLVLETRLFAGNWWGKGEPLVISAKENGRIEGVAVRQVMARSENGIVIAGENGNIRDVELSDWSLNIGYGRDRTLFKPFFDLWPAEPIAAPDPAKHIPGLYAEGVRGIRVNRLRCVRPGHDRSFSMERLVIGGGVTFEHCDFGAQREAADRKGGVL